MEKLLLFNNEVLWFYTKEPRRFHVEIPLSRSRSSTVCLNSFNPEPRMKIASRERSSLKVCAGRRRRMVHERSETYVLLEPGEEERFVSQDELRLSLQGWLEKWPEESLPPDLARLGSLDDVVSFLVSSVCELDIPGDVGSVQWYEVHLE